MRYGITVNHDYVTQIGSVFILENFDDKYYIVKEGNCDLIKKDAVKLISKNEYDFIRKCQNEIIEKIDQFSDDTKEYFSTMFNLRNKLD